MEYILASAIHFQDGKIHNHQPKNIEKGFVVCGRRHHNCYMTLAAIGKSIINWEEDTSLSKAIIDLDKREVQGFITNTDRFVDRKEGFIIAFNAKQLLNQDKWSLDESRLLISEMLW